MSDLSSFAVTRKWPAQHPDRIQLYSLPTPNGVKASIMLEETGLAYEPHLVSFDTRDQFSPEFLSLNPYGKIPAILDPSGPNGKPLGLFESGAILIYLAEKTGRLLPQDAARRYETIEWVMFQVGAVGPMFGQVGFFHKFAGKDYEDKRPRDRYVGEAKRVLGVLNQRLADRPWILGDDYSIADIAIFPWLRSWQNQGIDWTDYPHLKKWFDGIAARAAVQRGVAVLADLRKPGVDDKARENMFGATQYQRR